MTTKHYSEADLLETYYTQPGESMPVMMHLASCSECAARYERLDHKLREAAVCHHERPETFWARQRLSIMRKIGERRSSAAPQPSLWRVAAAMVLAFLLGGAVVYETVEPELKSVGNPSAPAVTAAATATHDPAEIDLQTPRDPWDSDELQDFHGVVQWESWVAQSKNTTDGDASL